MTPPNILLICTDQQRFDAVGAYGNPHIATPNLDRLAARGVTFENCYVQNTVCSPSRASLMTGRYVPSHGLYANGVDLPVHEVLFSRLLADAGYDCGLVGKLHLGSCFAGRSEPRVDDGFRVFRWSHAPNPGSSESAYHRWLRARFPDLYESTIRGEGPYTWSTLPTEAHYSRWIGDETIEFLRTGRQDDSPFFFVANFFDPHPAFGAPKEYVQRYDATTIPPPAGRPGELEGKPPVHGEASAGTAAGNPRNIADYSGLEVAEARRAYYAMVTLVDDEVGRILDTLEQTGLAENTLVVFTSDHGEMLGDHALITKGPFMYEGAIRVPLIVCWPGVTSEGGRRTELVQWVDLAPTFLSAAGVEVPARMQGASLAPLLGDRSGAGWRDWAICHYRDSAMPVGDPAYQTMLRHDRWKIVHHGAPVTTRARTGELYDLRADPDELVNLWDDAAHRDTKVELQELLMDVMVEIEDRGNERLAPW